MLVLCWLLSGRFDFHVQLPAPAASERQAILRHEIQRRSLQCSEHILSDVAAKCDGYDAYDLVFVFTLIQIAILLLFFLISLMVGSFFFFFFYYFISCN